MKKIFMFLMVIMLTACGIKVSADENNYEINIIEDEITLEIGESYRITVSAPSVAYGVDYTWLCLEGDRCIYFDGTKDIVKGTGEGRAILEASNSYGYKDQVVINVIKGDDFTPSIMDFGYIHFFLEEGNETYHYNFFSNGSLNTHSFSYGDNESSKTTRINFKDYGVTSFIGGDSIRLTYSGEIWTTMPYPAGDSSIFGELYNVEYFPSEIYEVTLDKEVIEEDQIHIGFNTDFVDFDLENYYVISLDENNKYIKKDISEYEDGYTFYYSFNTLMENPHKYSFLYDYKVR